LYFYLQNEIEEKRREEKKEAFGGSSKKKGKFPRHPE